MYWRNDCQITLDDGAWLRVQARAARAPEIGQRLRVRFASDRYTAFYH